MGVGPEPQGVANGGVPAVVQHVDQLEALAASAVREEMGQQLRRALGPVLVDVVAQAAVVRERLGGTIGVVLMSLFGPTLAAYAVTFSPSDYVALMVFAFASLASLVGKRALKTLIAALIGNDG